MKNPTTVFVLSFLLVFLVGTGTRLIFDLFSDINLRYLIVIQVAISVLAGIGTVIIAKKKNEK